MFFLLPEVFEESLHGVVVGFGQLSDQVFDGLNSMLVVWNLCRTENKVRVNNLSHLHWTLFPATILYCFTDAVLDKVLLDAKRLWDGKTFGIHVSLAKLLKGVVCNSNSIHFLSNSANISSRSASGPFCVCSEKKSNVHTQPWFCKWETDGWSHNSLDNSEFDCGIICVYGEYLPLHLSPVSGSFKIGVSKSSRHTSVELIWLTTAVWSQNKLILQI